MCSYERSRCKQIWTGGYNGQHFYVLYERTLDVVLLSASLEKVQYYAMLCCPHVRRLPLLVDVFTNYVFAQMLVSVQLQHFGALMQIPLRCSSTLLGRPSLYWRVLQMHCSCYTSLRTINIVAVPKRHDTVQRYRNCSKIYDLYATSNTISASKDAQS